ncbi:MAG TPA: alpha/beta hydrolase-fold protein [Terracidiphilus sp.]|jgi:poly(3-hydroxybutyrate) depolymerase
MVRFLLSLSACLFLALPAAPAWARPSGAARAAAKSHHDKQEPPQETGFLNRRIDLRGVTYRFQVYLPEEWRRDDHKLWPIILFLHGRGERGSEGMWQTQIGLPQAVRDHPDRWPFVIVMPQCPQSSYWTDADMLAMAMAALDRETEEFHGDPERTYLTGLSLGGYGAWELGRDDPHRWAAIAIAAGGVFWSYAPERWQEAATLPAEYARPLGRTPVWLFHGTDDPVVPPRESELMFEAFKANGGNIRLWLYQGLRHDCWTRAYDEPELPRWLLAHRALTQDTAQTAVAEPPSQAERIVIPFHPPVLKLSAALLDSLAGEYCDQRGRPSITIFRQGDQLYEKNLQGEIAELAAESPASFFYLNGSSTTRLIFEHDAQGRVTTLVFHDDRHEERWEKRSSPSSR